MLQTSGLRVKKDGGTQPGRSKTGVPGLDDILNGGLIPHRLYLVDGNPSAGKTTLSLQFLSDIGMPEMDGYELLRRVRALEAAAGGKAPAVALTAFARSEDRLRALRAGYLVHMSKPVEPSELIATIATVAGRPA